MAIGATNNHSSKTLLLEILDRGLQNPPQHAMLILQDLFQSLDVNIRRVQLGIMSQVSRRDPTRIERGRWTAHANPSEYFEKGEILLFNSPHHQTGNPTHVFSAVFTKAHMEELVNNRHGRMLWYVISFKKEKIV